MNHSINVQNSTGSFITGQTCEAENNETMPPATRFGS